MWLERGATTVWQQQWVLDTLFCWRPKVYMGPLAEPDSQHPAHARSSSSSSSFLPRPHADVWAANIAPSPSHHVNVSEVVFEIVIEGLFQRLLHWLWQMWIDIFHILSWHLVCLQKLCELWKHVNDAISHIPSPDLCFATKCLDFVVYLRDRGISALKGQIEFQFVSITRPQQSVWVICHNWLT